MMEINQCTITLTRNCNLRCDFCYAKKTKYLKELEISEKNIKRIIDFCARGNIKYIVFSGGEPTLYKDLINILKYIKENNYNLIPVMSTNGIALMDKKYSKQILEAGMKYIDISLKGANEIETEKVTGLRVNAVQMEAIKNLSDLKADFTCSMVITKDNVNTFCDAIDMAKKYGAKQFSFTLVVDNDETELSSFEYIQNNNPRKLIIKFMSQIELIEKITEGQWWLEYTFPLCLFSKKELILLKGKMAKPCHVHEKNAITFDTKLNLIPCNMLMEYNLGVLGVDFESFDDFVDLYNSYEYQNTYDILNKLPSNKCNTCDLLMYCQGGCKVFWKNFTFADIERYMLCLKE